MKAYLTSIGEQTTDLCKLQLEKFGFDVKVLDEKEDWPTKYKRFIDTANEDCLRIDADVILFNDKVKLAFNAQMPAMVQWKIIDFYTLTERVGQPVFYSKELLEIIKKLPVNNFRPETSMWRNPEVMKHTHNINEIVALHGFWQSKQDMKRAKDNRIARVHNYDQELVDILNKLNDTR